MSMINKNNCYTNKWPQQCTTSKINSHIRNHQVGRKSRTHEAHPEPDVYSTMESFENVGDLLRTRKPLQCLPKRLSTFALIYYVEKSSFVWLKPYWNLELWNQHRQCSYSVWILNFQKLSSYFLFFSSLWLVFF